MRSTRIRGQDRPVTVIPNAILSKVPIVNFTQRDRMFINSVFGVHYETTPGQLRYVLAKIRELLLAHPKVTAEPGRVRFTGFGSSSLNLEVFAYVDTGKWEDFLAIQEDINLRIMHVIAESGRVGSQGWFLDGGAAFCDDAFGSDFTYQTLSLTAKHYWSLAEGQVIAFSAYGHFGFGDMPFFALSMFGANNSLRGYSVGRYQDRMLLAGQAEYRFQLTRQIGLVAFEGVGTVAPDFGGFRNADALPGGGLGVRFLIAPKNKVNFRVDVAGARIATQCVSESVKPFESIIRNLCP